MNIHGKTERTLPWKDNLAYSMGSGGINFMFGLVSFYLLFFFTDVLGITAAAAGTLLLVARIWDAIFSLIMGTIVDRTHTRWGKFRPYILFGLIPCWLLFILNFYTPDLSVFGKTIWAYATHIPLLMAITCIYIPYHAMSPIMTTNSIERAEVGTLQQIIAFIATLIIAAGTLPMVGVFATSQQGFFYTAAIVGFLAVVSYFITFCGTKRYDRPKDHSGFTIPQGGAPFMQNIKVLTQNRPLLSLMFSYLFFNTGLTLMTAVSVYFFKYYIKMESIFPVFMGSFMVTMIVGAVFVPVISRMIGKKNLYQMANLLAITAMLVVLILCFRWEIGQVAQSFRFGLLFFMNMFIAFWTGPVIALIWGIVPDTVEFAEWKVGIRAEGLIFAFLGFMQKTSLGISGVVSGFILSFIGYMPNREQTDRALLGFLVLFILVPLVFRVIAMIAMAFYNLTEKDFAEIVQSLNRRGIEE